VISWDGVNGSECDVLICVARKRMWLKTSVVLVFIVADHEVVVVSNAMRG
jgi:hypothetical protein